MAALRSTPHDMAAVRCGRALEGVAAGVETSMLSFISTWIQMYSASTAMTARHTACKIHHDARLRGGER